MTSTSIIPTDKAGSELLPRRMSALEMAGQAANRAAASAVFADYRSRKAENTIRRQDADLALFSDFLQSAGVKTGNLAEDPQAWQGITWGLVEAFARWQLTKGYAVGSVNVRLSTVKTYAKLALKAGTIQPGEYAMIRAVEGYSRKEGKRVDERREAADLPTRKGEKKADPVTLTRNQAKALKKTRPMTPQGRRDALLMCLMIDHGLRVGEVAGLQVCNFDLQAGELRFYRPKVDLEQTHKLTSDTLQAARLYLAEDAPAEGIIWRGSRKDGSLTKQGLSERAITQRVAELGAEVGAEGLSAHDLRHYWATLAARNGTPIDRLQDAGGWASPAMPLRYVERAAIANKGVLLGD